MALNLEDIAMEIIANSGMTRSISLESMKLARQGKMKEAFEKLATAEAYSVLAHNAQTALLTSDARGEVKVLNVLTIHAQDHLMTSLLAYELASEIITLYETKADK